MREGIHDLEAIYGSLHREGQGPAIVLIHGSADVPQAWAGVARLLRERFTVFTPALPPLAVVASGSKGHGKAVALDTDLPWLEGLLEYTGARLVAAHSYGALLALRFSLAHPEALSGLVLAEPIAWGMVRDAEEHRRAFEELSQSVVLFDEGHTEAALEWLIDYWNGQGYWSRLPERIRKGLIARADRTAAEVRSGSLDQTHAAEVAQLRPATCLIAGAATTSQSLYVQHRLAQAIPNAQLRIIPEAGHQHVRSHPEPVAEAIVGIMSACGMT